MRLALKVVSGASRDQVAGWVGDRLKVAVTAPPERGKANRAVVELLARTLGLRASRIRIVAGEASALKTAELEGVDERQVRELLPPRS